MDTGFRSKRITKEIQLFKEAFPNTNITHKNLKIVITKLNFKCIIELSPDWPFLGSPIVLVNYDNYAFYQPPITDWNPIMDIRTVFYDVLSTIENGSYKNLERIQNDVLSNGSYKNLERIQDELKKIKLITSDQIDILKINYPNIKVSYCEILNSNIISLDDLKIIISSNEINVFENENDWPKFMIPNYNNNISDIIDEIWYIRNLNQNANHTDYISRCKNSLGLHFDDINYNENHQTFIINSLKYLIIIGININSQYLSPMVIIYNKGTILSISYDFSNWLPDNLGNIITDAIKNYENS
jgi:hypothetical protein